MGKLKETLMLGFVVGFVLGAMSGVMCMALCVASARRDKGVNR